MRKAVCVSEAGGKWELSVLYAQICCEPKIVLKKLNILKTNSTTGRKLLLKCTIFYCPYKTNFLGLKSKIVLFASLSDRKV